MIRIQLSLPWQIKDEVSALITDQSLFNLISEPLEVGKEEVSAVEHASVWTKLELFHSVFELNQVLYIDIAWVGHVFVGRVQVDKTVFAAVVQIQKLVHSLAES